MGRMEGIKKKGPGGLRMPRKKRAKKPTVKVGFPTMMKKTNKKGQEVTTFPKKKRKKKPSKTRSYKL